MNTVHIQFPFVAGLSWRKLLSLAALAVFAGLVLAVTLPLRAS